MWVFVGTYNAVSQNGGAVTDLQLEFVAHSYTNCLANEDSITYMRFKAGSTGAAGQVFFGNGQAYYIGQTIQPYSFVVQQNGSLYNVYAALGNYAGGSSVIIKSNNFSYVGSVVASPPTGQSTISITPMAIYTADNPPNISTLPGYNNIFSTNTDGSAGLSVSLVTTAVNTALQSGTLNVIRPWPVAYSSTKIYLVNNQGFSYPIDNSSTISVNKNSDGVVYLNLNSSLSLSGTTTIASAIFTGTVSGITAAMVGLGNVNNTSDANKPISNATQTALNLIASLTAPIASPTFTGTVSGITAAMVGLGNVNNLSLIHI